MALIVADTDVLIDFLAGRGPSAARVQSEIESGRLVTTTVARFELLSGAKSARQRRAIGNLLEVLPALPLDSEAADRAALVRLELERSGASIGMADCLIAGIVLVHDGELLTRNVRHFSRVSSLRLASADE